MGEINGCLQIRLDFLLNRKLFHSKYVMFRVDAKGCFVWLAACEKRKVTLMQHKAGPVRCSVKRGKGLI